MFFFFQFVCFQRHKADGHVLIRQLKSTMQRGVEHHVGRTGPATHSQWLLLWLAPARSLGVFHSCLVMRVRCSRVYSRAASGTCGLISCKLASSRVSLLSCRKWLIKLPSWWNASERAETDGEMCSQWKFKMIKWRKRNSTVINIA